MCDTPHHKQYTEIFYMKWTAVAREHQELVAGTETSWKISPHTLIVHPLFAAYGIAIEFSRPVCAVWLSAIRSRMCTACMHGNGQVAERIRAVCYCAITMQVCGDYDSNFAQQRPNALRPKIGTVFGLF